MNAVRCTLLLSVGTLAACSFMGLDDFDLRRCDVPGERSPCDELNADLPAGQCEEYVCTPDTGLGCLLKPRDRDGDGHADAEACGERTDLGELDCDDEPDNPESKLRSFGTSEICDGIDNDCDGWVDEGVKLEAAALREPLAFRDLDQVGFGVGDDETLYFATTRRPPDERPLIELGALAGDDLQKSVQVADGAKCKIAGNKTGSCDFRQIAIAATQSSLFSAAINHDGCRSGQLWAATGMAGAAPAFGAAAEGSIGIDLLIDDDSACTMTTDCSGATQPALGALPAMGSATAQALLVWTAPQADPMCTDYCAECSNAGPGSIAALGLMLDGQRVTSTTDGQSEIIGDDAGYGPAAVAAWPGPEEDAGYFVAYAGRGQIELRFVPRFVGPSTSLRAQLGSGSIAAEGASQVALALDAAAATAPRGLAVAFRAERAGRSTIALAPLAFDRESSPQLSVASEPIEFETGAPVIDGPVLTYARYGFAVEPAAQTGGWLLLWTEGEAASDSRLMAARVAQAELHRLGAPSELAQGAPRRPFAYTKQTDDRWPLRFGYVTNAALHLDHLDCNRLLLDDTQ